MGIQISVSKASRLLGMSRAELSDQLQAANVATFEGSVDFEALRSVAPAISLCEEAILSRVRHIREDLTKRDRRDPDELSRQELEVKLKKLNTDLMVETRTADQYETILVELARKLGALQASDNQEVSDLAISLCEWLRTSVRE